MAESPIAGENGPADEEVRVADEAPALEQAAAPDAAGDVSGADETEKDDAQEQHGDGDTPVAGDSSAGGAEEPEPSADGEPSEAGAAAEDDGSEEGDADESAPGQTGDAPAAADAPNEEDKRVTAELRRTSSSMDSPRTPVSAMRAKERETETMSPATRQLVERLAEGASTETIPGGSSPAERRPFSRPPPLRAARPEPAPAPAGDADAAAKAGLGQDASLAQQQADMAQQSIIPGLMLPAGVETMYVGAGQQGAVQVQPAGIVGAPGQQKMLYYVTAPPQPGQPQQQVMVYLPGDHAQQYMAHMAMGLAQQQGAPQAQPAGGEEPDPGAVAPSGPPPLVLSGHAASLTPY